MEEAAALMMGASLLIGVVGAVLPTLVIWAVWIAVRRLGPKRFRGPTAGFPGCGVAVMFALIALPVGCAWVLTPRPQPASARMVRVIEIPLRSPEDRADLIALFRREGARQGLVFLDTTESWRTAPPPSRKTLYIALDRMVDRKQEWEITAEDDGPGTDPWVTFLYGVEPKRAAATRESLAAALKARFPDAAEVPVLASGGAPFRRDLERVGGAYRIRPDRAASYLPAKPPPATPSSGR